MSAACPVSEIPIVWFLPVEGIGRSSEQAAWHRQEQQH
jgi:hypothetical protein